MQTVLLVEDNEDDVFAIKRACARSRIPHSLQVVHGVEEARDYLDDFGKCTDRALHPLPQIILLDLSLPGRNGLELLHWLRSGFEVTNLPVIIFSGSDRPVDIESAHKLGATSFVVKSTSPEGFDKELEVILKYWFELNKTP